MGCFGGFDVVQFDLPRGGVWGVGVWLGPVCIDNLNLKLDQHLHVRPTGDTTYVVMVVL